MAKKGTERYGWRSTPDTIWMEQEVGVTWVGAEFANVLDNSLVKTQQDMNGRNQEGRGLLLSATLCVGDSEDNWWTFLLLGRQEMIAAIESWQLHGKQNYRWVRGRPSKM